MLKLLIFVMALVASSTVPAQSVRGRTLGGPVAKQMAYFTQDVTLIGGNIMQSTVGPLGSSLEGYGINKNVTKLPASPVGTVSAVSVPNPVAQDVALQAAVRWAADEMPGFQSRVGAWLTTTGISAAVFSYTQEIMVSTTEGPKRRAIAFNATIDNRGRPTYGNPKIVDPDPTLLEAVYTPLAPAAGLPADWKYPEAGTLKYRLLNKRYEVISNWVQVNVSGRYDAPDSGDVDAGLKCLVDARLGACTPGFPTIRSIIDSVGATWGLLTYIRQLEPLYEINPQTGEPVAVGAITVDKRRYDCDRYYNEGNYGFVLALTADQYVIQPQSNTTMFTMVGALGGKGLSPTVGYNKSVPIIDLNGLNPDLVIISPEANSNELWRRTDRDKMKSVIFVSPVVSELAGQSVNFYGGPSAETPIIGQTRQYTIGQVGNNYFGFGQHDQQVYFDLPGPNSLEKFVLKSVNYDDLMMVVINGVVVFDGPFGGNMLELAGSSLESDCAFNGSNWNCFSGVGTVPGGGASSSGSGTDGGTVIYSCPPGQAAVGAQCFYKNIGATYLKCTPQVIENNPGDRGEQTSSTIYYCGNSSCPMWTAQYLAGNAQMGAGCANIDLGQNFNSYPGLDMRPYLRAGQNNLFIRTVVGGLGEGFIEVEARTCGTEAGLANFAPPGPGVPAVNSALFPRLQ